MGGSSKHRVSPAMLQDVSNRQQGTALRSPARAKRHAAAPTPSPRSLAAHAVQTVRKGAAWRQRPR